MPLGKQVAGALAKVAALPFEIKLVCPSHGVLWRSHFGAIVEKYKQWSTGGNEERIVLVYETMWGSTEKMARALLEGIESEGVQVDYYRLSATDRTEIVRDILTARGLIIGASTVHNGILPNVGALLYHIKGLRPVGKHALAFGSQGWAGGGAKEVEKMLCESGITVDKTITCKWKPSCEELQQLFEAGAEFARTIKAQ